MEPEEKDRDEKRQEIKESRMKVLKYLRKATITSPK
jgi:hypothetical protein